MVHKHLPHITAYDTASDAGGRRYPAKKSYDLQHENTRNPRRKKKSEYKWLWDNTTADV